MWAREFFRQVLAAEKEIKVIRERQAHYMELATGGAGMGMARRVKGNHHSQVETAALSLAELSRDMEAREKEYAALIQKAEGLIARLDRPRQRQVLELRYLCGLSWEDVAEKMGYTDVRSAYRVHGWALLAVSHLDLN